jgi:hypothetical protein
VSRQESKRQSQRERQARYEARQRERQARYEARQRAGVMLALVPLGPDEINALVRLRWLPASTECSHEQVGAAAAAALRSLLR